MLNDVEGPVVSEVSDGLGTGPAAGVSFDSKVMAWLLARLNDIRDADSHVMPRMQATAAGRPPQLPWSGSQQLRRAGLAFHSTVSGESRAAASAAGSFCQCISGSGCLTFSAHARRVVRWRRLKTKLCIQTRHSSGRQD